MREPGSAWVILTGCCFYPFRVCDGVGGLMDPCLTPKGTHSRLQMQIKMLNLTGKQAHHFVGKKMWSPWVIAIFGSQHLLRQEGQFRLMSYYGVSV